MNMLGLVVGCIAAIGFENIRLPSPHTAFIQQDFLFGDRHALEFTDNYLYLQTLKTFLDKFTDVELFEQIKIQIQNQYVDSERLSGISKLRKNSNISYKNLMIQKCGISDGQFEALDKYASRNSLGKKCLYQLKKWNQDLIEGNYFAQESFMIHKFDFIFAIILILNSD